mmetsp:Transcript_53225/g.129258  ORF Transcript_53225/g.129258 Transcript_53225/m.129258 type:complete len:862 (+) Transcript_53225:183-2768(+)
MTLVVARKNLLINASRVGRLGNSHYIVVAAASITNSNWNWLSTTSSDWKIQHQHHHQNQQQQRYFYNLQLHPKNGHPQCVAPSLVYGSTRKQNLLVPSRPLVMLQQHQRFFSSPASENHNQQKIRILYASQTGTAQLFANELQEAIEDQFSSSQGLDVTVQSLQEAAETEIEAESSPSKIFHVFDDDSMPSSSSAAAAGGGEVSSPRPPTLHIMLTSCAGVGEPPNNGRDFYEYIMNQQTQESSTSASSVHYSVFGLGNKVAHTKYFNVIGKNIDAQLEKLGCTRVLPLALGDDGDCIEDDFDVYVEQVLELIRERRLLTSKGVDDNDDDDHHESTTATSTVSADSKRTATSTCPHENDDDSPAEAHFTLSDTDTTDQETSSSNSSSQNLVPCHDKVTLRNDGMRLASEKYAPLDLQPPQSDIVRRDLFHLQGTNQQYYASETQKFQVVSNQSLAPKAGETAIHEMTLSLSPSAKNDDDGASSSSSVKYETGDHLVMYPRNSSVVAEAYLQLLDVHPHAIVQRPPSTAASSSSSTSGSYPYPTGLTVLETLLHCVDLEAPPSPSFARMLLGRKHVDYRSEIAKPRRTVLDLLLEKNHPLDTGNDDENRRQALISLEDLLYNLTPMKPRYYSISSSSIANPDEILLAYRPIKYVTTRGALREGVCTSYMMSQAAAASGSGRTELTSSIPAFVSSNPTFRLPEDPQVPIVLVAGGCGVAPICAFVEERLAMKRQNPNINFGPCDLYIGFRSPEDQVYAVLGEVALKEGAISDAQVAYNFGCTEPTQHCMFVSDLLRLESAKVWKHLKDGGVVIVCGAGRTLGAAVEAAMMDLLQEHGGMTWEEAEIYMRKMVEDKRLLEDLAD